VLDRQLAGRDNTFSLVADVEKDLVTIDLDNGAFDDVAVVEVFDRRIDCGKEIFRRSDVVYRDLRRLLCGGRGLDAAGHKGWNSVGG